MKALQCNRCRNYFNPKKVEGAFCHFENPDICTAENYVNCVCGTYLDEEEGRDAVIDLCPECTESFILFMRGTIK